MGVAADDRHHRHGPRRAAAAGQLRRRHVTVALIVRFALALVYAFVFALIAKGRSVAPSTVLGALFGLVLYVVNFYAFTAVFPWFAEARNWISVVSHLAFGAVLGATYAAGANRR